MAASSTKDNGSIPIMPQTLLALMLVVALFGPASIYIVPTPHPFSSWLLIALCWVAMFSQLEILSIIAHPIVLVQSTLFLFLRIPFAYQTYRYYKGRTTRIRTLFLGIISELQHSLFWVVLFALDNIGVPVFLVAQLPIVFQFLFFL